MTLLALASVLMLPKKSNEVKSTETKSSSQAKSVQNSLQFVAMGDMLAHDSIVAQAKKANGYDFTPYFKDIRPLYKDADVVFCNPETISVAPELGQSGYPTFNAPREFADGLVKGAGCNLINLASNHQNDKHQAGIDANLAMWEKQPVLAFAGTNRSADEQKKVRYFTKNGMKVAFLAFADYSNDTSLTPYGLNSYHDTALFAHQLQEARRNADAVVLSMHWGTEDTNQVNDDQLKAAQLASDNGVDVILGTGPHVLQKVAWVDGKNGHKTLVWYSIGNMLSSQLKPEGLTSIVAGFKLTKATSGVKVSDITAQPTYMSYSWSPADRASDKLEARKDFRLHPLSRAGSAPTDMFGSAYSVQEREKYITDTLGNSTGVTIAE